MSEVFAAFGVDWRLLVINLINFGLLLLALWYFLYGPLTKMLEARRQRVVESMRNAAEVEKQLHEVKESRASVLAAVGKDADQIIAQARVAALSKEKEIIGNADLLASARLKEADAEASQIKAQALTESKQEVAKLIVLGMEKVMHKK